MKFDSLLSNSPAEELARLRESRSLVARAEVHKLREALDVHAKSIYGREIWNLTLAEIQEIDATLSTLIEFLDDQVLARRDSVH